MSEPNYVDLLTFAATSLAEEGRINQADILRDTAAAFAQLDRDKDEFIAQLRADLQNAQELIALCTNADEIAKLRSELDEARKYMRKITDHDIGIWDGEYIKAALAYLAAHPEPDDVLKKHIDSGDRCLVGHRDGERGQCVKCVACGQWLRPHQWDEECPGKRPDPVIGC